MGRKTSPPKASGGGGFNFEDKVAAWWMLHILAGRPPLDSSLPGPSRIRFQARVDGWLLDDLVVDFPATGRPIRAAVSVKSGEVIVAGKAPGDFVMDCWSLCRKPGTTGFNASRDMLVLATRRLAKTTRRAIDDALARAVASPLELDKRVARRDKWCGEPLRKFVRSFKCPRGLRKQRPKGANLTGPLLRAVRICDYDFEKLDSDSENDALKFCRELVEGHRAAEARIVWRELNELAKERRPNSGTITLADLLERLRGKVRLKAHPDYAGDWQRVEKLSAARKQDTKDTIGPRLHLPRAELQRELSDALEKSRAVAIIGESGTGKSALVKDRSFSTEAFYCLDASDIVRMEGGAGFERLDHRFDELLATQPSGDAVLVLDRLDRLTELDDFKIVARTIEALRLESPDSGWRLILICQHAAWDDVTDGLRAAGFSPNFTVVPVGRLEGSDLRLVADENSSVASLLEREELRPVVTRPKVLDLLVGAVSEGVSLPDPAPLASEASLIEWFWSHYICIGQRDRRHGLLLTKVAGRQADERRPATPLVELTSDEAALVPELERLGILLIRNQTVRFRHDLYADYARQRYVLGQWESGDRAGLRSRAANPLWHRAIRLLALHYMEQPDTAASIAEWRKMLGAMSDDALGSNAGADLLLEAVGFASRACDFLEALLPDLCANQGALLMRFLSRVFFATTVQTVTSEQLANLSPVLQGEFAAALRQPQPALWRPILDWIVRHREQVLRFASPEFLAIAELWVGHCRKTGEAASRTEVEDMILTLAERVAHEKWDQFEQAIPSKSRVFLAAICCVAGHRERLTALMLHLSGRTAHQLLGDQRRPEAFSIRSGPFPNSTNEQSRGPMDLGGHRITSFRNWRSLRSARAC